MNYDMLMGATITLCVASMAFAVIALIGSSLDCRSKAIKNPEKENNESIDYSYYYDWALGRARLNEELAERLLKCDIIPNAHYHILIDEINDLKRRNLKEEQ